MLFVHRLLLQSAAAKDLFYSLSSTIDGIIDDKTMMEVEEGVVDLAPCFTKNAILHTGKVRKPLPVQHIRFFVVGMAALYAPPSDNHCVSLQGSEALCGIMYAVLRHCPDLKYSRGLHQLAAFMLVGIGMHWAERAFWSLVGFIRDKLFPDVQGQVGGDAGLGGVTKRRHYSL